MAAELNNTACAGRGQKISDWYSALGDVLPIGGLRGIAADAKNMKKSKKVRRMRYRFSTYVKLLRALTIGNLNSLLNFMGRVLPGGNTVRPFLQRLRGVKIGDSVWIGEDVCLDEECPGTIEI
jgi:hypothetical protein